MICPILSQAFRDKEGNVGFDHHECIESACTFWAEEVSTCGIRASGLLVIGRARAALKDASPGGDQVASSDPLFGPAQAVVDPQTFAPLMAALDKAQQTSRDTGLKLLEGVAALEEPLKATGQELGGRLEALNAAVLGCTTTVEGRINRLEQGIHEVRQAVAGGAAKPVYVSELEQAVGTLSRRLGAISDRFHALAQSLEAVSSHVTRLSATHEEISAALSNEAERRRHDEARQAREEARNLNTRGVALFHKGATEAALAAFRQAAEMDPVFAEAHNNLGLALSRMGNDEEARASFQKALELDPGMAEAVNNLGFLFHKGMEFEKAVEMFRRAAVNSQDAAIAYTNLGNACYGMSRYTEAVDAWRKALEHDPHNEHARRALQLFQQNETRPS